MYDGAACACVCASLRPIGLVEDGGDEMRLESESEMETVLTF